MGRRTKEDAGWGHPAYRATGAPHGYGPAETVLGVPLRGRFSCSFSASGRLDCCMRIAICPGSFDPLTNGHLDVIQRATKLFDQVIVAVAYNDAKQPLFTVDERMKQVAQSVKHLPTVKVDAFDCLLVDFAERLGAQAIIRGLRAVSDFEFEFQLALMNRNMNERVETIFMMPKDTYTYLSSRMIKEIARLGGDVSTFVPAHIRSALDKKLKTNSK